MKAKYEKNIVKTRKVSLPHSIHLLLYIFFGGGCDSACQAKFCDTVNLVASIQLTFGTSDHNSRTYWLCIIRASMNLNGAPVAAYWLLCRIFEQVLKEAFLKLRLLLYMVKLDLNLFIVHFELQNGFNLLNTARHQNQWVHINYIEAQAHCRNFSYYQVHELASIHIFYLSLDILACRL